MTSESMMSLCMMSSWCFLFQDELMLVLKKKLSVLQQDQQFLGQEVDDNDVTGKEVTHSFQYQRTCFSPVLLRTSQYCSAFRCTRWLRTSALRGSTVNSSLTSKRWRRLPVYCSSYPDDWPVLKTTSAMPLWPLMMKRFAIAQYMGTQLPLILDSRIECLIFTAEIIGAEEECPAASA